MPYNSYMKNYSKINKELFEELQKFPEGSKEYEKIVGKIVENNARLVYSFSHKYNAGGVFLAPKI